MILVGAEWNEVLDDQLDREGEAGEEIEQGQDEGEESVMLQLSQTYRFQCLFLNCLLHFHRVMAHHSHSSRRNAGFLTEQLVLHTQTHDDHVPMTRSGWRDPLWHSSWS